MGPLVPSSMRQQAWIVARGMGLAMALAVTGLGCAGCSLGPSLAQAGGATHGNGMNDVPIFAHFKTVIAGPAVQASGERAAPQSPMPTLKPPQADRRDAMIALLKSTASPAATMQPSPARVASVRAPKLEPAMPRAQASLADAPSLPAGASAQRASGDHTEALQRELRARDAVIADLLQRVEQLERRLVLSAAQLDQAVGGAGPVSVSRRSSATVAAPAAAAQPAAAAPTTAPDMQVAQAQEAEPSAQAAPGQFEVDPNLVARALERTLVQEGVLLLPFGQAEIEPSFSYTRREVDTPGLVTVNGDTFVGEQDIERDEFQTGATLRVGLPFDSQIEVGIPYNYVDESVTTRVGGAPQASNSESGHGFGDVSVGLAKTLLQEGAGWWPDVIARVTWDADTGKTRDNGVFLGGGFNELSGSLSAVKRQDPLAFVGSVSYAKTFEHDDIEPGDELGFSLGTVLAASPETSLSFFFIQTFAGDTEIDGDKVNGSDQVIGTFSIGAATILGRNVLLSITGEIGLTDDAPDYAIGASLPIRFDLPVY